VRFNIPQREPIPPANVPWALEMKAASSVDPSHLVRTLSGAILGCGGWVLSRSASDTGRVNILFEFERQACVEIYTAMVAAGIELSQNGHIRMTELCHCTRNQLEDCGMDIASIDLLVQTLPHKAAQNSSASGPPPGKVV
jgi:hypothetical protein